MSTYTTDELRGSNLTGSVKMTIMTCGECGIVFAVPEWWRQERRQDLKGWYCPNGHCRVYRESETDELRRKLAKAEADRKFYMDRADYERTEKDHFQRRLSATRGQLTKTRKRIANGVCPCCHRTFQQLARHMASQHPEYGAENAVEVGK